MTKWLTLAGFVVTVFVAAGLGGLITRNSVPTWYAGIHKPSWTPPNWLFGPVWTLLYISMAVAAWLNWQHGGWEKNWPALSVFALQLILNAAWTPLFFGAHRIGWALVDIVALWAAIGTTLVLFWRADMISGAILIPYWCWVSFAVALNYALWRMNP